MPKPIDHAFFKDDWERDENPTQPYESDIEPSNDEGQKKILTEEALDAYDLMKKEVAKYPIAKMRMQEVQRAASDYLVARANLNIASKKKQVRGEPTPYTELAAEWKERGRCHEILINALKSLVAVFTEYKLDNQWQDVVGLHDREKIAAWAFRVGDNIASDLAQEKRKKGGVS